MCIMYVKKSSSKTKCEGCGGDWIEIVKPENWASIENEES
jgi:hypothetical protein